MGSWTDHETEQMDKNDKDRNANFRCVGLGSLLTSARAVKGKTAYECALHERYMKFKCALRTTAYVQPNARLEIVNAMMGEPNISNFVIFSE